MADAVNLPVVAAGGIGDGRGLVAALALGVCGIQMGTRFILTKECNCHPVVKEKLLEATEEDTRVTGMITGSPMRALVNPFIEDWLDEEKKQVMTKEEFQKWGVGRYRGAIIDGNWKEGTIGCGQICGMIRKVEPAKEIIERIMKEAETVVKGLG